MLECWNNGYEVKLYCSIMGSGLRLVEPTLSPSCKLYEQEAGLEALRAGSGLGEDNGIMG
jgi:hypothetical protein